VTIPGKGTLILTGSLGDVMKESASAALSLIKASSAELQLATEKFEKNDIHIHIPEGAIPKDGPSAGVTLATALISAFTGTAVKREIAMTGEITLRARSCPSAVSRRRCWRAVPASAPSSCPKRTRRT
jgi:ATP-dependent Lon protease